MSSAAITSNWLGLKLHTPAKLLVGFCGADQTIPVARAPNMTGDIETFVSKVFSTAQLSATQVWAEISAATNAAGAVPTGVTYVAKTVRGGKAKNYVGKTFQSMAKRYPGTIPVAGGLAGVFAEYAAGETIRGGGATMDVTLYWTTNPSLVEGWCFAVALSQKLSLENVLDPG